MTEAKGQSLGLLYFAIADKRIAARPLGFRAETDVHAPSLRAQ